MIVATTVAAIATSKRRRWQQFAIILIISLVVIVNILFEEEEDFDIHTDSISSNPSSHNNNNNRPVNSLDSTESYLTNNVEISRSDYSKQNVSDLISPEVFKDNGILQISVLGERHSGTTWIFEHLEDCFGHTLGVARHLTRYKHWFQFDDGQDHNKTLAISLFRNPYYWVEAMRKIPHHSPMHVGMDWKTFVSTPWTMPRIGKDLNITNTTGRICQDRFYYNEVISCIKRPYPDGYFDHKSKPKFSGHQPYYELKHDGSGAYNSIIELRTAKIKNFFEMINYSFVHDYWPLRYEELLEYGTAGLLQQIEHSTGVQAKCKPYKSHGKSKRELEHEFIYWMNENLNWDVEALIGYNKVANASDMVNLPWLV